MEDYHRAKDRYDLTTSLLDVFSVTLDLGCCLRPFDEAFAIFSIRMSGNHNQRKVVLVKHISRSRDQIFH